MKEQLLQVARKAAVLCRTALPRLWREPALQPRELAHGTQVTLCPSPMARRAQRLLMLAQLVYAIELILLGHWWLAGAIALLAMGCAWACRRTRAGSARLLLIASDGRLHLLGAAGEPEPVTLHPCSMRLGPWLLVVLQGRGGTRRLLLGPDNVAAGQLADLRRRVSGLIPQRLGGTR